MTIRTERWIRRAASADAEIVRIESEMPGQEYRGGYQKTKVFPVVRFTDQSGKNHECRARTSIRYKLVETATVVAVLFDPSNPDDVRLGLSTDRSAYITGYVVGIAFLVAAILGIGM
jgi:hypothetical protein